MRLDTLRGEVWAWVVIVSDQTFIICFTFWGFGKYLNNSTHYFFTLFVIDLDFKLGKYILQYVFEWDGKFRSKFYA